MFRPVLFAFALLTLVGACSEPAPQELAVLDAQPVLSAGETVLIDVRRPEEWKETGRAPGAVGITLQDEDFLAQVERATGGDHSRPVVLICRSGNRSGQAAARLVAAGYTDVYNVTGGMMAWQDQDLPVERWSGE